MAAAQTDAAGNHGASPAQTFVVDTTAPEIDVSGIHASYAFGAPLDFDVGCGDTGSGIAACEHPTAPDASPGTHDFPVTATDRAGNTRTVHAHYTVIAPAPVATPTPVVVAGKAPAALKITRATATRKGRAVTLTLRGTAAGSGAVTVSALEHSAAAKLVRGLWTATLKLKTTAKKLTVSVTDAGDATHRTGSARETVAVR